MAGGVTSYGYDSSARITNITSPKGDIVPVSFAGTSQTQRHSAGGVGYANGMVAPDGQPSRVSSGSTTDYLTRLPDGTPISLRSSAGTASTSYYYTLDCQGSARRLTAAAGTSDAGIYSYDHYGQETALGNTLSNESQDAS